MSNKDTKIVNPGNNLNKKPVMTPAGPPPVYPKKYGGRNYVWQLEDPWPESFDEDTIKDWAEKVKNYGRANGFEYTKEALIYWARYFWSIETEDFEFVRRTITEIHSSSGTQEE